MPVGVNLDEQKNYSNFMNVSNIGYENQIYS